MRTRIGLAGSMALAVLAMLALAAGAVLGHAALESSDPPDGATIKTPYTLTATFDEELAPDASSIKVEDSTGKEVATGGVSDSDDKHMTVELPQLLDGEYTVLWTAVTADDSGVTRGTYTFNVAAAASTPAPTTTAAATAKPTAGSAVTPAPAPSPTPTSVQIDDGGAGISIAVVAALVVILAIAGFFIYRNRS